MIPFKFYSYTESHVLYNKSSSSINKNRMLSCNLESNTAVLGTTERLSDNTRKTPNALYCKIYIIDLKWHFLHFFCSYGKTYLSYFATSKLIYHCSCLTAKNLSMSVDFWGNKITVWLTDQCIYLKKKYIDVSQSHVTL